MKKRILASVAAALAALLMIGGSASATDSRGGDWTAKTTLRLQENRDLIESTKNDQRILCALGSEERKKICRPLFNYLLTRLYGQEAVLESMLERPEFTAAEQKGLDRIVSVEEYDREIAVTVRKLREAREFFLNVPQQGASTKQD